jgi:D-aspartate ligase
MGGMPQKTNGLKPAVVLSSHTIGLGVIRALGVMGVPVVVVFYEKNDMGYVSRYVRESIFAPHPEHFADRFIGLLKEYARKIGPAVLIPADDSTLKTVSRYKDELEEDYIVAATDYNITDKYLIKKNTYEIAENIGIPIPRTIIPKCLDDVKRFGKSIEYPCVLKPCESHSYFEKFRKKMVMINNSDQLLAEYQKVATAGFETMIQEFIPGDDTRGVNYNSYLWNGTPLLEFTAEKVRLAPPVFGVPRVAVSKVIPEILDPGRKILQAIGFTGYSCTEFKRDPRDGVYKLMEVNGRHNRSTLLAVKCGINFPWLHYRHLVEGQLPEPLPYKIGVYWIDEIRDVLFSLRYFNGERYRAGQYLKPYLSPHIFAIFDIKDVKPFLKRCFDLIKTAASTLLEKVMGKKAEE